MMKSCHICIKNKSKFLVGNKNIGLSLYMPDKLTYLKQTVLLFLCANGLVLKNSFAIHSLSLNFKIN